MTGTPTDTLEPFTYQYTFTLHKMEVQAPPIGIFMQPPGHRRTAHPFLFGEYARH